MMGGTTWYLHGENNNLVYEREDKANGVTEHRHYLQAGGMTFALAVSRSGSGLSASSPEPKNRPTQLSYFQQDHLGSIAAVLDENGANIERMAYDPWGKRRSEDGKPDPSDSIVGKSTDRGYTEHEHLDEVGVIHMNGRLYDPLIGRFMSADPFVQYPYRLQSFNRYAYVLNNPLRFVDPSGFLSGENDPPLDTGYRDYGPVVSEFFTENHSVYGSNVTSITYANGIVEHFVDVIPGFPAIPLAVEFPVPPTISTVGLVAQAWSNAAKGTWNSLIEKSVENNLKANNLISAAVFQAMRFDDKQISPEDVELGEQVANAIQTLFDNLGPAGRAKGAVQATQVNKAVNIGSNVSAAARGGESAAAAAGRQAHNNYGTALGAKFDTKVTLPSGKKPDAVDWSNREVRELKPDNARAVARGERQVEGYRNELEQITGQPWTSVVDVYRAGK